MPQHPTIIEVKNMIKHYGATVALNDVSFSMRGGEICGLIGENGSGKSTVSSIIAGMQPATSGQMLYKGERWHPSSMLEAQTKGIGMVVQEAGTIPNITVAENLFLGHEELFIKGPLVNKGKMITAGQQLLDELGMESIKACRRTADLDMQDRKLVEIARALCWQPDVFIVDETTTALSHNGRQLLYKLMHSLAEKGKCVIFISHDLEEMIEHSDSLTVLRDGVVAGRLEKAEFNEDTIRRMMVGREISGDYYRSDLEGYGVEVVLRADQITTLNDLLCFSLELHKGEILGIGGLSHCGMHTLGKALFGIEKVLDGEVRLADGTVINKAETAINRRMGYVSKNRDTESLGMTATILENIASLGYRVNRWLGPLVSGRKEKAYVDEQVSALSLKCASINHPVDSLSGGNKQKVAFGKWMATDAEILILDCPTRGIDIGVKAAMYKLMIEMKRSGKSIVLISEELLELIGMSDRLIIMKDGEITCEKLRSEGLREHELIMHMI